jgi:hypothetical protein
MTTPSPDIPTAPLAPALAQAVTQVYAAFSHYHAPTNTLDVCLGCCMDPALEKQMRTWPLRELGVKHFYQYNTTALSPEQPVDEIKYLLPRLLELTALGAEVHHGLELNLKRVGNCPASAFSPAEHAALAQFAHALLGEQLQCNPWEYYGANQEYKNRSTFELLLMCEVGGIAIEPLLAQWLSSTAQNATLQYANAVFWEFLETRSISATFAQDRPTFQASMAAWLHSPANRAVFANRLLALDWAHFAPQAAWCRAVAPDDMLSAVFDFAAE